MTSKNTKGACSAVKVLPLILIPVSVLTREDTRNVALMNKSAKIEKSN